MHPHGPKRIYTPQSLEFWFDQLEDDWNGFFTPEQLAAGQRLYRNGEIRELELTDTDAIIHRRVDRQVEYIVIEWGPKGPLVRSSTGDNNMAGALAVAGLHEIEELIADEIAPVPEDVPARPLPSPEVKTDEPAKPKPAPDEPADAKAPAAGGRVSPAKGKEKDKAGRVLHLVFQSTVNGLAFDTFWVEPGSVRVPALGNVAQPSKQISSEERGKLIGLAAYARKGHFSYSQETGRYLLADVSVVVNFLRLILPAWKKQFSIEVDTNVARITEGPRPIRIEAVVSPRRGGQGLDLRWIFKAGEHLLTDKEVALLTESKTTSVILPDIGIVTQPINRLATIHAWQSNLNKTHGKGALSPYLIFSLFSDKRLQLTVSPELAAWRESVLAPPIFSLPFPDYLRPYQRRGVEWLHHLCDKGCHALLADEMGLGKTLQVITLMALRPVANKPSLIVCPASVVPVWQEEIARFQPGLSVEVLKGGHDFSSVSAQPNVWLASYAQLRKHCPLLARRNFGYAVLDEGQFIKNPDAKITQACLAIHADHRIVLSGTPLENHQLDLWSIFRFLLPGLLGPRASFESALNVDRDDAIARLRAQLAPFILRRTKSQVATELPQKIEMSLICPLTNTQRAEYARVCNEGLNRLGDDVGKVIREKSFTLLALLTRLRQVCCDPDMLPWRESTRLDESGKLTLLVEKLAEIIEGGHKVVIFSQFVMLLRRVQAALSVAYPQLPRYELTGMTLDRLKPVQAFQAQEGPAAMLVSLKAAGTGITLHSADYVFLLDPWWNPAVEAQAVDRVHRIGQTSTVFVYRMVTAGTIEERIGALKAAKQTLFDQVIDRNGGDVDLQHHFASLRELVQLTAAEASPGSEDETENAS